MKKYEFPNFFFLFKIVVAILGSLKFLMNFRTGFPISEKNTTGVLIRNALNLKVTLGSIILIVLNLPVCKLRMSSHLFKSLIPPKSVFSFQ